MLPNLKFCCIRKLEHVEEVSNSENENNLPFSLINNKTVSKALKTEDQFNPYSVFVIKLPVRKLGRSIHGKYCELIFNLETLLTLLIGWELGLMQVLSRSM